MIQFELEFFSRPPVCPQPTVGRKKLVLSPEDAAIIARVEVRHIYYALTMGEIEAWKVGWLWRLWAPSVEDYAFRRGA